MKYYTANRDTILAKMREREAQRREVRRKYLEENPTAVEEEREKMREKYYKRQYSKTKKLIEDWLNNPLVNEPTKKFWKDIINTDQYKVLTPKLLKNLEELVKA